MIRKILLNGRELYYDLQRKRVKNMNLRIKPDMTIHVSANSHVSVKVIEEFMRSKADFILRALDRYAELEKYAAKPNQYADGEIFRFLGEDKILKVVHGAKNTVEYDGDAITLYVTDTENIELKKKTADKWIKNRCEEVVLSMCRAVYPQFEGYGIPFPTVRFRSMVSRWGSCQPKNGVLTFNTALVKAPLPCIEYVVYHEFTHFLHPDHSKDFYCRLETFLPDWRERKALLQNKVFLKR